MFSSNDGNFFSFAQYKCFGKQNANSKENSINQNNEYSNNNTINRSRADTYALEMTIQLKKAERETKRRELEIEFAAVFEEVHKKKKALTKLENALTDMEATRERKEREFKRLQKISIKYF